MKDPRELSRLDRQMHEHEVEYHEDHRLLIGENGVHKIYFDYSISSEFRPHDSTLMVEYKRPINPERLHIIEEIAYDYLKDREKPKAVLGIEYKPQDEWDVGGMIGLDDDWKS